MVDPTGMSAEWIPGKNGNEYKDRVTYTEVNGKIEFENLQDDLKPLFEELVKTPTGKKELLNLIDDQDMKVSIYTNDEKKVDYDHNLGKDSPVNGTFRAKKFNNEMTAILEAEIYVYQGWRKESFELYGNSESTYIFQSGKAFFYKDFTQTQISAGDLLHEIRHRFPENHPMLSPGTNTEGNPNFAQGQVYSQMLINKQNDNKNDNKNEIKRKKK